MGSKDGDRMTLPPMSCKHGFLRFGSCAKTHETATLCST
jgi:hypothetical protein